MHLPTIFLAIALLLTSMVSAYPAPMSLNPENLNLNLNPKYNRDTPHCVVQTASTSVCPNIPAVSQQLGACKPLAIATTVFDSSETCVDIITQSFANLWWVTRDCDLVPTHPALSLWVYSEFGCKGSPSKYEEDVAAEVWGVAPYPIHSWKIIL